MKNSRYHVLPEINCAVRRAVLIPMILIVFMFSTNRTDAAVRATDVAAAGSGCVLVQIPGTFSRANVSEILKLVNQYRKEACTKGYPDPRDASRKLTSSDYKAVKWSGDLEWIAQTRAAEGTVLQDHERPNGGSIFDILRNEVWSSAETLAWNFGSLTGGIEQWYEEKGDWVAQNRNAVTGHYTAMIDPDVNYIGVGCFTSTSDSWSCVAGAYSYDTGLTEGSQGVDGAWEQTMEVLSSALSNPKVEGKSSLSIGTSQQYAVQQTVKFPGIMGDTVSTPIKLQGTISWSVSNASIATISSSGVLTGLKKGSVMVTARLADGKTASRTVQIVQPAKGTVLTYSSAKYKVTKAGKEVAFSKYTGNAKKVVIPGSVTIGGTMYKVTSIANNAFKGNTILTSAKIGTNIKTIGAKAFSGCKKLKSITIPAKVTKIGKQAFYNCKKLKTVTIKTTKLKASSVGAKAFGKTGVKKIKVPKSRRANYSAFLYAKGIAKSAVVK